MKSYLFSYKRAGRRDRRQDLTKGGLLLPLCHCEPVITLAWQSVTPSGQLMVCGSLRPPAGGLPHQ